MKYASACATTLGTLALSIFSLSPAMATGFHVFVSGLGNDANACTLTQPCRTFQRAHDVAPAGGEIDVLDPGGYGSLTISKSIIILGHGFATITVAQGAIGLTVNAGIDDRVSLSGLVIDGAIRVDRISAQDAAGITRLGTFRLKGAAFNQCELRVSDV